jgi:hypothetical protein
MLQEQIQDLEISISEREYELQGAIPKSLRRVSNKKSSEPLSASKKMDTSVPTLRKESSGSEIVKHQQTVSTTGKFRQKNIGAVSK